jgi:hypothetical protein
LEDFGRRRRSDIVLAGHEPRGLNFIPFAKPKARLFDLGDMLDSRVHLIRLGCEVGDELALSFTTVSASLT